MKKHKSYKDSLLKSLKDPVEAAAYLAATIEECDRQTFLVALKDVAEARLGSIAELAKKTGLSRGTLYRTLSGKGNPEISSLGFMLNALGLRLSIEAKKKSA